MRVDHRGRWFSFSGSPVGRTAAGLEQPAPHGIDNISGSSHGRIWSKSIGTALPGQRYAGRTGRNLRRNHRDVKGLALRIFLTLSRAR